MAVKPVRSKTPGMVPLPWHADARMVLDVGDPPLLLIVGDPGVGKTTFARQEALARTGNEPIILPGSPEVELSHIFGRMSLVNQETVFIDGPLPRALKSDRWLVIEEFSLIPPETRASLMPLRDQATITNPLTGEVLPIPAAFRLIATSNSENLTCRKNLGVARMLYDGFYVVEAPELSEAHVRDLLRFGFPKTPVRQIQRTIDVWNDYREFSSKGNSGKAFLSLRAAEHFQRLVNAGMSEDRAVQIAFVNKFKTGDDDLFQAAKLKSSLSSGESVNGEGAAE